MEDSNLHQSRESNSLKGVAAHGFAYSSHFKLRNMSSYLKIEQSHLLIVGVALLISSIDVRASSIAISFSS